MLALLLNRAKMSALIHYNNTSPTMNRNQSSNFLLGLFVCLGLAALGYLLSQAIVTYKQLDRSVTVKGLSEREFVADVVIWPIQYAVADNELTGIYQSIERNNQLVKQFLVEQHIKAEDISFNSPSIIDKSANDYGGGSKPTFRFSGQQTVTVYSSDIKTVQLAANQLAELGKQGIVISGDSYGYGVQTQYLFTRLNEVKPQMIEEATRNARQVAEKFAIDSSSKLGKIKKARQGQFSIQARDQNNPHIKKVRVVSTIEYYLSD